jgi:hypothetical protein
VGANPVDRGKPGSKLHRVCDGGGLPLTAAVTAANVADTTVFAAFLGDIPPIRSPAGRRRTRPAKVHADKGYDSRANRAYLRRRQIASSARPGRHRWKVERALSWPGLLQAVAGALGLGRGAMVCVRPGGLRGGVQECRGWGTSA